jgi:hypothetical protein
MPKLQRERHRAQSTLLLLAAVAFSPVPTAAFDRTFDSGSALNASALSAYANRWQGHLKTWRSLEDERIAQLEAGKRVRLKGGRTVDADDYVKMLYKHYGLGTPGSAPLHWSNASVVDYGGGPGLLGYALLKRGFGIRSYTNVDIAQSSLDRTLKNLASWSARVRVFHAVGPRDIDFASLRPDIFCCVGGVIAHMSPDYFERFAANVDGSGAAELLFEYRHSDFAGAGATRRAERLKTLLTRYELFKTLVRDRDFTSTRKYPPAEQRRLLYFRARAH